MKYVGIFCHPCEGWNRSSLLRRVAKEIPAFAGMAMLMLVTTTANAQDIMPLRTISVTGQAERKIAPDEAHLQVNLNAQEVKLAEAKKAHDAKLNKLIAITRDAGISDNKIRTESSNTQPIYIYENDQKTGQSKRIFKGYRVQTNVDVTINDTTKLADIMDKITLAGFEKGANTEWGNLLNLYYTISKPDAIRDEIMIEAISNARSKAQKMATAAGAEIARVHSINESSSPQFIGHPKQLFAMSKSLTTDSVEAVAPPAGEQQMNAIVTVVYELK